MPGPRRNRRKPQEGAESGRGCPESVQSVLWFPPEHRETLIRQKETTKKSDSNFGAADDFCNGVVVFFPLTKCAGLSLNCFSKAVVFGGFYSQQNGVVFAVVLHESFFLGIQGGQDLFGNL